MWEQIWRTVREKEREKREYLNRERVSDLVSEEDVRALTEKSLEISRREAKRKKQKWEREWERKEIVKKSEWEWEWECVGKQYCWWAAKEKDGKSSKRPMGEWGLLLKS